MAWKELCAVSSRRARAVRLAVLASVIGAVGCVSDAPLPKPIKHISYAPKVLSRIEYPTTFEAVRENMTVLTYDDVHGPQVAYHSADGRVFLWYPGNAQVLPGRYELRTADMGVTFNGFRMSDLPRLCYKYGAGTFNPATGRAGGDWECLPEGMHHFGIRERMRGDPVRLSKRGPVPFVLPKAFDVQSFASSLRSLWIRCSDC